MYEYKYSLLRAGKKRAQLITITADRDHMMSWLLHRNYKPTYRDKLTHISTRHDKTQYEYTFQASRTHDNSYTNFTVTAADAVEAYKYADEWNREDMRQLKYTDVHALTRDWTLRLVRATTPQMWYITVALTHIEELVVATDIAAVVSAVERIKAEHPEITGFKYRLCVEHLNTGLGCV